MINMYSIQEKFEDTKVLIRSLTLKKKRQYNGPKKKIDKRANNNLQTLHRKLQVEQH